MKKYILLPALLSLLLAWHLLSRPEPAPEPDPENYIYHTPEQLDSLWMEEIQ